MCRLQTIDLLDLLFIMSKVAEQPTILRGEDTNINSNLFQQGTRVLQKKKIKIQTSNNYPHPDIKAYQACGKT